MQLRENFLSFQSTPIPRSITELEEKHSKLAVQVHKSLLAYMGDKPMPYPAILAQDILQKGYDNPPLRDEIFALIIKQLTANPRPESVAKGWQVLCMCVHTFPPSIEFENFLLHFILERRDRGRGAVVDYANFCLHSLEAMLANGDGTGFVPSALEILAYKQRPPVLASIYLVDGNTITENLPITPDLQVGNIIDMCTGWLDLKDPRTSTFGLFVYDLGEYDDPTIIIESSIKNAPFRPLIRTPRPLRNDEYLGDVVVQVSFAFNFLYYSLRFISYLCHYFICSERDKSENSRLFSRRKYFYPYTMEEEKMLFLSV